ncbi:S8 family serine peptidase [Sulfitobacter sp. JBTF-M27]|uniref:S8 family serine peptidase n=1 Tax=Sulfitobacter sediminilitoris TaxID=2698830 RepID=A0A6P0CCJ8_9RHOB|nr:S8 family serine peptidase [Sulfitobacter sediminilitoris]NEK23617.1 S8 family serine peptidase [Sulfitobacter sediminilitoris]
MAQQRYADLQRGPIPQGRDPLSIELVTAEPVSENEISARVRDALPDATFAVEAAFDADADRYHFVDFPDIDPHGQEADIFAFARDLRAATQTQEANPVLPDSLYGAHHVAGETEGLFSLCETPRDNSLPFGWHHPQIDTIGAWQHTKGNGSTVAVIDTGYSDHAELHGVSTSNGEINLVEGGTDARDRFSTGLMKHPGHGTLVMSVVASRGTANAAGQTGVPGAITGSAPAAKVMPIRAIRSVIDFNQRRIATAIDHAVAHGADVISMALGGPSRVASTEAALRRATNAGVVIVCAAGNCWPSVVFPAAYAALGICTAVAALQPDRRPWKKSGRGGQVSFSAFGEQVWGAAKNKASDPAGGIRSSQGTTLATSMTAGVAALWVAKHGGRAPLKQIADQRGTTVQAMWVKCATAGMQPPSVWNGASDLGAGVLNARAALEASLPAATEAPAAPSPDAVSTLNILQLHLIGSSEAMAADAVSADMADLAPELIWLSYRTGAKKRMLETDSEAVIQPDVPSPAVAEALANTPALRAAIGG